MNRWLTMSGLGVVLVAAAVLSFAALRDLAIAVAIDTRLSFLLPIAVDAGAAVSCAVWLSPGSRPDARRFSCWLTWALLGATVVGNASQLGMHANHIVPPWWVAVAVGAVPPAVVGGVVHLLVLVGRAEVLEVVEETAPAEPPTAPVVGAPVDDKGVSLFWQSAPAAAPAVIRQAPLESTRTQPTARRGRSAFLENPPAAAIALAGQGLGKVLLQREVHAQLGIEISEHEAKELLSRYRTNGHQVTS